MKVQVPDNVVDYYTDILTHCYEPDGDRMVVGTTMGKILVMDRDNKDEMAYKADTILPDKTAVLGLHWCKKKGIFIGAKSLLYLLKPEEIQRQVQSNVLPFIKFEGAGVNDVCSTSQGPSENKVFGAGDDGKIRVWDVETQQLISELADHKSAVEVCNANNDYLVSGSQDGHVCIYDCALRTKAPVNNFDVGRQVVSGLDISQNSTWVAAGSKGSPLVYNVRNNAILPKIDVDKPDKIYVVHFDYNNNLWWAGGGNMIYRSGTYSSVSAALRTSFGDATIHHLYSITSNLKAISVAGSSTCILISENGDYWEEMVSL